MPSEARRSTVRCRRPTSSSGGAELWSIPPRRSPLALVMQTRKAVQVPDMRQSRSYLDGDPLPVAAVDLAGIRTLLLVPMFKEDDLIGAIVIYRQEVRQPRYQLRQTS